MKIATLAAALLLCASSAQAQLCPNDQYTWPTNCVPSYVGPSGNTIPEKCATIGPDIYGQLSSITIYDPQTGYSAPTAVIQAAARQDDLVNLTGMLWGNHRNAAQSPNGEVYGLDYQQLNEMAWLVATAPRDNSNHVRFIPWKANEALAWANQQCGSDAHCKATVTYLGAFETSSTNWGNKYGYSVTNATMQALFDTYRRAPQPNPPLLCGVAQ